MVFSSIIFVCVFMPIVFLTYYLCPGKFRNLLLFIVSLIFYAWGEPKYIFVMLFSTVYDYCNGRLIYMFKERLQLKAAKIALAVSIVGNLGILLFFKYTDFIIKIINVISIEEIPLLEIALPIGISFYTFQTMSYTIDVYRGRVEAQRNIIDFAMYVCMFPQLIAGPIVRYEHVAEEIHDRKLSDQNIALGFQRFIAGLGKKVIFANQIGVLWDDVYNTLFGDMSMSLAWLGAVAYTLQIYFDFSGYSDMAIGMGQMLGFDFPENFNHPYQSKSITEFWRRWHISLSTWFKEYVYIPLGGNRKGLSRQVVNLFIVWSLTGLWHGAAINFLLWGIYFFVLLILEKWFLLEYLKKVPKIICHLYSLIFIAVGWVIFACEDFDVLGGYLKAMLGIGVPFVDSVSVYKWYTYIIFIVILAFASTEFPKKVLFKLEAVYARRHPTIDKFYGETIHFWIMSALTFLILIISMAFLVSGSYNPFLYFRF